MTIIVNSAIAMEDTPFCTQKELSISEVINTIESTKKLIATLPFICMGRQQIENRHEQELTRLIGKKAYLEKQLFQNDQLTKTIDEKWIHIQDSILGVWANNKNAHYFSFDTPLSNSISQGITVIDISKNNLEALPLCKILLFVPNVEKINASENKINTIEYQSDQKSYNIIQGKSLTELDLSYNKICSFDFDTQFEITPHVNKINLSHNPIKNYIWQDASAWKLYENSREKFSRFERFPYIDLQYTNLNQDQINNIKIIYRQKNIQCNINKGIALGASTSVLPGISTIVGGLVYMPSIIPALGLQNMQVTYPFILLGFLAVEVGTGAGIGYLLGSCFKKYDKNLIKMIEQKVLYDALLEDVV
jgi:hypothetical protein